MARPRLKTSQAARVSILKRVSYLMSLVRPGAPDFHARRDAVMAFFGSDDFRLRVSEMSAHDCVVAMHTIIDTVQPIADQKFIPPRAASYAERVKWDDATVATLRAIVARYGLKRGVDRQIAREMRIPLRTAITARTRYVGLVERARGRRKRRPSNILTTAAPGSWVSGSPPA
jgi:hypothetical protein